MKYVLKKADQTEVEEIFSLYRKQIQWINEKGINQWNNNGYLHNFVTDLTEKGLEEKS